MATTGDRYLAVDTTPGQLLRSEPVSRSITANALAR